MHFPYLLVFNNPFHADSSWSPFTPLSRPLGRDLTGFNQPSPSCGPKLSTGSTRTPESGSDLGWDCRLVGCSPSALPPLLQLLFFQAGVRHTASCRVGTHARLPRRSFWRPSLDMKCRETHPTTSPFPPCYVWKGAHKAALSQETFPRNPLFTFSWPFILNVG